MQRRTKTEKKRDDGENKIIGEERRTGKNVKERTGEERREELGVERRGDEKRRGERKGAER